MPILNFFCPVDLWMQILQEWPGPFVNKSPQISAGRQNRNYEKTKLGGILFIRFLSPKFQTSSSRTRDRMWKLLPFAFETDGIS